MVPDRLTRRDALRLSSMTLVGLAGCGARGLEEGPADTAPQETPTATEREHSHSVATPETITVRNAAGKPAVRSSARSPEENVFESSARWDYEDWIVTSSSERNALSFSRATNGVEAARDFIAATDLSEATLLVHQYDIGECESRQLDRLNWSDDVSCGDADCVGVHLEYERTERDGDCQGDDSDESDSPPYGRDSYDSEATLVRIPARMQSYGRFSVQV